MKTILHVLSMNWYSGAENVVITLIRGFHERNLPYRFIYASPDGPIREIVEENEIEFQPIESVSVGEVKRLIRTYHPDIIHAHDRTASIVCAIAAGRIPVISQLHNNSPLMKRISAKTAIYGISCLKYKEILGVSEAVFDEFVFGKVFRKKEHVVGNPIDLNRIREKSEEPIECKEYDVCYLGRLDPPKNPLLFLQSIRLLCDKQPEIKVAMIGDGEMAKDVKEAVVNQSLSKNISLLGFQKNPYPFLKKSKLFCITSTWEGFGLAAVEALALGKPVIATPVGGLKDIITEQCGMFCETAEEFSDAIEQLLDNKDLYRILSNGALKRAGELDNMESYISKIKELYDSCM